MAEFYVVQQRDGKIGDTWAATGVFGLNIGSAMESPEPCPVCGVPGQNCIGDANDASEAPVSEPTSEEPDALPEAA